MVKTGESLLPEFFTLKYPGREPKLLEEFLTQRPDVLDHKIFDLNLTSGRLLYLCSAGGIGFSKEPNMVKIHEWIRTPNFMQTLREEYEIRYGDSMGRWKYYRLRERFNVNDKSLQSWGACARLYLLWMGSNFTQRYRTDGYDGVFCPKEIDFELLHNSSKISKVKSLGFENKDIYSFKDSLITPNTILYSHLPSSYGTYGAGWKWNKLLLSNFSRVIRELSELGYKVLISAPFKSRGRVKFDYKPLFPYFTHLETLKVFKETKTFTQSEESEIYMLNF